MLESYFNFLKKSLNIFSKNPVLYAPFLLEILVTLPVIALLIITEVGIFSLIFKLSIESLNSPFAIFLIALFFFIDVFAIIPIFSYFRAMKIGLYKEAVMLKKTSLDYMFFYGKKFFKTKLRITLLVALVFLIPLLFFGIVSGLFYLISPPLGRITAIITGTLFGIYSAVAGTIVYFSLFFINPIITSQDKPPIDLIKMSFDYTKANLSKAVITWLIILLFSISISLALAVLRLPYNLGILSDVWLLMSLLISVIQFLVQTGTTIISDLFIFNVYFKLKK